MLLLDRCGVHTHGELETILRGRRLLTPSVLENGLTVLLCGAPGVGKTTVGLHLLNSVHRQAREAGLDAHALLLSLVETPEQLDTICRIYGFDFANQEPPILADRLEPGEEPDLARISTKAGLDLAQGDLLLVDGISVLGSSGRERGRLLSFLNQIKKRKLVAIVVAEEYGHEQDRFLEYAVDAIFRLGIDPPSQVAGVVFRRRWMEISKLRWHHYFMGPHAFRLQDVETSPKAAGVAIFPSARCLIDERRRRVNEGRPRRSRISSKGLASGVAGFDAMIGGAREGGYRPGERVLLIGPSGSGKFRFGTQFLAASEPGERPVCVSFVRDAQSLKTHFAGVRHVAPPDDGKRTALNRKRSVAELKCEGLYLNATAFGIEELLGAIHNLLSESEKRVRLFLDGVSVLRCRFSDDPQFELFLRSLLDLICTFPQVTTLVSFQTARVFASYTDLDIPASDLFSTVVGFNFQEQSNRVDPGIVILKSGSAAHDASLRVPSIIDGEYTINPQAGWSRVGLLSGAREQVHEERPFVKLFFENRSEHEVLTVAFDEFKEHYPSDFDFHMVGRNNPQPSHWSFRGYAGPGHSNTKLVQLRKYVMDMLRDDGLLLQVPPEVEESLVRLQFDRFDQSYVWADCTASSDAPRVMIPSYCDVGVLVYQQDGISHLVGHQAVPETWSEMLEQAKHFKPSQQFAHLFVIPNVIGDHRNFVSFFFELCWTHGWDFPSDGKCPVPEQVVNELKEWVDGPFFDAAVQLLRDLIDKGKPDAIPNPNIGGHFHKSVFSRRWFSKTMLLPTDVDARISESKPAFQFGIAPLPGVRCESNEIRPGISNVDLYAIGVIRQALAPETAWMLASALLEADVDVLRVKRKRGLPVSRRKFETRLVQENLCAPPQSPGTAKFYETELQNRLFETYGPNIRKILTPESDRHSRFRRTADIPRFFKLEELLARELPAMFDRQRSISDAAIKRNISSGLEHIYDPS